MGTWNKVLHFFKKNSTQGCVKGKQIFGENNVLKDLK